MIGAGMPSAEGILDHLASAGPRYLGVPASRRCTARLLAVQERAGSRSFLCAVETEGAAPRPRIDVYVKVPLNPLDDTGSAQGVLPDRPRLLPLASPAERYALQCSAATAVDTYFRQVGDDRVAAVPVLDHIDDERAIVMPRVAQPLLSDLLAAGLTRPRPRPRPLLRAFRHAGVWLRAFHAMPSGTLQHGGVVLRGTADAFLDAVRVRIQYLQWLGCRSGFFASAGDVMPPLADVAYRTAPKIVRCHGDYAPRNIFVDPDGPVSAFDVNGRWATPAHEDVAYFLMSIAATRRQVLSQGAATRALPLRRCEDSFLAGYYEGGQVPRPELRAYEALMLLDRWVALAWDWTQRRKHLTPFRRQAALSLTTRFFERGLERILREVGVTAWVSGPRSTGVQVPVSGPPP